MDSFFDYNAWLDEEKEILAEFKKSVLYFRFEPIFLVLKEINTEHEENSDLDMDIVNIFEAGFQYIYNIIDKCKIWAKNFYDAQYTKLFENHRTVLLMLMIDDVLEETEEFSHREVLLSLEEETFQRLKDKKDTTEEDFYILSEETKKLYRINKEEHTDIVDIFTDIAEELCLMDDPEDLGFEISEDTVHY